MNKKGRKQRKKGRTQPQPWNRAAAPPAPVKDARYRCLRCEHAWEEKPKPVTCPACKHVYVKWVNYNEDDWSPEEE